MLTAVACLATGCRIVQPMEMPAGHYYLNQNANFSKIGKVVLLELENITPRQEQSEAFTQALADGIGKKHLFSVRTVFHDDQAWQMLDLDSIHSYTHQQLGDIREKLGADAVIFGTINRCSSYPYFLIGINLKMVDLRYGKLLWAIEEVWDGTDLATEQRMKHYFETQMSTGYQPMNWQVLETSPRYFNKFVVYEITRTLPQIQVSGNSAISSENKQNFSLIPESFKNFVKKY